MTTITVDLPTKVYERLNTVAQQQHSTIETIVKKWITEKSAIELTVSDRDRSTAALRSAGLLSEPSPELQRLAAESTLTLEEARAILDRAGGKPLSEFVLEMRGPKE